MSIPNAEHGVKVTNARRQRGAGLRVYDLRVLQLRIQALEASRPGPATDRLGQKLRSLEGTRDQATWNPSWRTNFVNLDHELDVAERRGPTASLSDGRDAVAELRRLADLAEAREAVAR